MRCQYCHNPDTWEINNRIDISADEIIKNFNKNKHFYKNGGITASGGEPMMQLDFLIELFQKAKINKIHTCLDTSGIMFNKGNKKIEKLLSLTDLILLDIKHIDNKEHLKLTGCSNENILEFAKYLDSINKPIWIRHVLISRINTNKEYLINLNLFLKTLNNIEKIEILPFHNFGSEKYKKLKISYQLDNTNIPSQEDIDFASKILLKN